MTIQNVTINALLPTVEGTSKAGNPYVIKECIIGIDTNAQYPQQMLCKTMSREVITALESCGVGATLASIDVDFAVRDYNGRYYGENKLWRVNTATVAPVAQPAQQDANFEPPF